MSRRVGNLAFLDASLGDVLSTPATAGWRCARAHASWRRSMTPRHEDRQLSPRTGTVITLAAGRARQADPDASSRPGANVPARSPQTISQRVYPGLIARARTGRQTGDKLAVKDLMAHRGGGRQLLKTNHLVRQAHPYCGAAPHAGSDPTENALGEQLHPSAGPDRTGRPHYNKELELMSRQPSCVADFHRLAHGQAVSNLPAGHALSHAQPSSQRHAQRLTARLDASALLLTGLETV